MSARLLSLALAATLLLGPATSAGPAPEPATVGWNLAWRSDRLVGEIWVGGHVIMRLRQDMGGLDVQERTCMVAHRLESAIARGLRPGEIEVGVRTSGPSVELPWGHLVIVGEETAAINGTTAQELARVWADRLRVALGGGALPDHVPAVASWYGPGFHGRITASGEMFDQTGLTAAHRDLPFGTRVKVTNPATGVAVTVRINDRGPFITGRDIDLSRRAAEVIGILRAGVACVWLEIITE